jgi:hypothetical protein
MTPGCAGHDKSCARKRAVIEAAQRRGHFVIRHH